MPVPELWRYARAEEQPEGVLALAVKKGQPDPPRRMMISVDPNEAVERMMRVPTPYCDEAEESDWRAYMVAMLRAAAGEGQ